MDRAVLVRRAFHLSSPAWLVWYWVPPGSWIDVRKEFVLLFLFAGALLIEGTRLFLGFRIPGLREYEADRISGYAWGSLGLAVGLLVFPGELVIPTFWGMAWIDPMCGYLRKAGRPMVFSVAAYVALWLAVSTVVVPWAPYQTTPLTVPDLVLFAPIAGAVAVAVERPNLKHVDDDFLMFVVPLLALAALSLAV